MTAGLHPSGILRVLLVRHLNTQPPTDPISSYDVNALSRYFETYVKRPMIGRFVGGTEGEPEVKGAVGPLSVALKIPLVSRLARDQAFRYAGWLWLRPNHPCWNDLNSLQKFVGLEKYAFAPGLKTVALEHLRNHVALRLWIERRLALLEFSTDLPPGEFENLQHTALALRRELFHALTILTRGDRINAYALARQIVQSALEAAGTAARQVLGKRLCPISVNLMLRTTLRSAGFEFAPGTLAYENAKTAAALWAGLQTKHALVILEEAGEPEHEGFWLPLTRGSNGEHLPGAGEAFGNMGGSAVFRNDLPPLSGFDRAVEDRWHGHMRGRFREQMFVSLPLTAPSSPAQPGQPVGTRVIAVLNVNADPDVDDGWRRAYHKEWLTIAKDRVAQFVEVAYFAHLIKRLSNGGGGGSVRLELGADPWQSLPGFEQRYLKGDLG